jgi:hypothetical protein
MQVAGQASWRFGETDGGDLRWALYIRDAGGLNPTSASDIPPALTWSAGARLGTASGGITPASLTTAAGQWIIWWRRLVGFQAAEAAPPHGPAPDEDMNAWMLAKRDRYAAVFDPPGFESLAPTPALQAVAVATFPDDRRLPLREPRVPAGQFDYRIVRAAAEGAIAEFGVDPGEIDGTVAVLDTGGAWSHLAAPGYALCSTQVASDQVAAAALLRAVFASLLG